MKKEHVHPLGGSDELLRYFLCLSPKHRSAEFLLVKQTAVLLNLHESRVRQLADEGRICRVKIFGRVYIYLPCLIDTLGKQQLN